MKKEACHAISVNCEFNSQNLIVVGYQVNPNSRAVLEFVDHEII